MKYSICSAHQEKDPNCSACQAEVEFIPPPKEDLVTCGKCNFVYYRQAEICPKCYKEREIGV